MVERLDGLLPGRAAGRQLTGMLGLQLADVFGIEPREAWPPSGNGQWIGHRSASSSFGMVLMAPPIASYTATAVRRPSRWHSHGTIRSGQRRRWSSLTTCSAEGR